MIVANGSAAQQEAKIGRAGLDRLAVNTVGVPLSGAWAIGDSPHADIVGANALGLRSVWVSNGQLWVRDSHRPTHVAEDVATAIDYAVGAAR